MFNEFKNLNVDRYPRDNRTFKERLKIGNEKEKYLVDILNLCGVPARLNNTRSVTDIDIELTTDDIFVDCKLIETPFYKAKEYTGIDPDKCIALNTRHIKAYQKKEKETGKKCWIAFFIDFKPFEVYELVFLPNSYVAHLVDNNLTPVVNDKINIDRTICRDVTSFLNYIKDAREIKIDREKNN